MEGFADVRHWIALAIIVPLALAGCHKKSTSNSNGNGEWDIETQGIPKFVQTDYTDLGAIDRISCFRSAYGHDYTHDDHLEHCRSMKHYFWPKGGDPGWSHNPSWTTIPIRSPIAGTVTRLMPEFTGIQIWIGSDAYPAFEFRIFHVGISPTLLEGDKVSEGQVLGHHGGDEAMSDIAVRVATPNGWRLVSYFDVMTDELFQTYVSRGVVSRSQLIITKAERDADSLTCSGEQFITTGNLENWVPLN
ncbi:MAG: hypothetical protein HZB43_10595 [candidate division Zixibacteria bacterium]|nr:hypothetical protein [candidate division Zixibacteria bacterium]